jgi:hypothetical protein
MSLRDAEEIVTTLIHYPTLEAYLKQRGITVEQFAEEQANHYRERIPVWYKDWVARRDAKVKNEVGTPPATL